MNQEHRTWFPFIMIGLSVLLLGAYIIWGSPSNEVAPTSEGASLVAAPTEEEYQAEVTSILNAYASDKNAGQTYEELLNVRVPAAEKEFHLDLVIAFSDLKDGRTASGQARIDLLRAQADWLP